MDELGVTVMWGIMSWVRALAWAVTGVSVAFAARYGIALGATAAEALALGATFAILDLFKCHLPWLTMLAMARRWSFVAIAGRVGFGGLSLLNMWGIMSVEILERAALAANQTTVAQQLTEFEAQKGRVENRLRKLGETREVATIEADMTAERRDRRWSASKGCTDATRESRYCAAYDRLFGELAGAQKAAELHARLDELDSKIATMRAAQAPNASELQLVAKLTGIDAETAGFFRAAVLAVVVEVVCAFALMLELASRPVTAPPEGRGSLPRNGDAKMRPSPANGSALKVHGGEPFAAIDEGPPGREEAAVPSSCNAVPISPVTPSESLGVVRAPTLGSGPGGGASRVAQGGAAIASNIAAGIDTRRAPAELHAATARRVPAASSRTRPGDIPGAQTRLVEGGGREDGCASRPQPPLPVITARCVCASHIADFVRECLETAEGASVGFAELRAAYHRWCAATGRKPVSGHRLGAALRELGFVKWKSCGRIRYRDLQLRA